MRVLLGHSYFLRFDPKLYRAMQPYPPLGTLYAAGLLRERGHEVRLFDAMLAESTDEWEAMLRSERPDVAVLFEDNFNYLSKMCLLNMREAAFRMLSAAKAHGVPAIAAGADVTDHAAEYLAQGADYAVLGEGDETVCDLLDAIAAGASVAGVAGLVYRDGGEERSTGQRPVMRELDTLPVPARDLVDLGRYREAWRVHGRFSLNLVTSRGCPFHCNWCAKPIWGQRYAVRSPESLAAEIEELHGLGAGHLWFMDDILGIKPGWLAQLADALEARRLRVPFKCLSRADLLLRPGEIDALKRAGCEMVWIGAESGSQGVLDAMEKGTTVEQIREAARRLHAAGIGVAFFLQFGYPGETWDDIQSTLQLVRDGAPDDIGMSVSYPLPGTPFYDRVQAQIAGKANWVDSEDMAMLYDGPYPTAFYHQLHTTLHTEFRLRQAGGIGALPGLLAKGRAVGALRVARDGAMLPLRRARLDSMRRRLQRNDSTLPVVLSRTEAGTPSSQDGG